MRYILQGIPVDENNIAVDFFKKRGYYAEWESTNMCLSLVNFDKNALTIPPTPETIDFRFTDYSDETDKSALLKAVRDAETNWVNIFETCVDPVMLAMLGGKIIGFQILSPNGGRFLPNENVGCIGCVGVIHETRKKGIGLRMVAEGADWLKRNGCLSIELRYVELVEWYKKIGFYTTGKQWMGEKCL